MTPTEHFYPISKVAEILRIDRPLALRLVRKEGLQAVPTPVGLRVDPLALADWVEAQMAAARQEAIGLAPNTPLKWRRRRAERRPLAFKAAA